MNTTLAAIEDINLQISKELAKYGWDSDDVKILLSMTGIDVFSAMLIATEIVANLKVASNATRLVFTRVFVTNSHYSAFVSKVLCGL
jgi:hypothetical protein